VNFTLLPLDQTRTSKIWFIRSHLFVFTDLFSLFVEIFIYLLWLYLCCKWVL